MGIAVFAVALVVPQRIAVTATLAVFVAMFAVFRVELRRSHGVPRHADDAIYSLQSLLVAVPQAFLAWNMRRGVVLWSDAAERLFGLARADVLGLPLPPELAPVESLQTTHLDGVDAATGVTVALRDRGGGPIHAEVTLTRLPLADGDSIFAALIEDTTPRRLREARRLDEVRAQRDALVREVHHRIKNSLHGVAGLLRQHLAGRPLLKPLLDAVTAQVLTIAAVHGLQSEIKSGALNLRALVARIAASISGIMHAPIVLSSGCAALDGFCVAEEESVPVAMMLNEILMNAVKHRLHNDGEALVHVEALCRRDGAAILVSNPGFLPPRFNLELGVQVGTGLGLVKSLLPSEGATLGIAERGHLVVATLDLLAPNVVRPNDEAPAAELVS